MDFIKHEHKTCLKCSEKFECKLGSILLCQCSEVSLTEDERDYIRTYYQDCLCAKCMKELQAEYYDTKFKNKLKKFLGMFNKQHK